MCYEGSLLWILEVGLDKFSTFGGFGILRPKSAILGGLFCAALLGAGSVVRGDLLCGTAESSPSRLRSMSVSNGSWEDFAVTARVPFCRRAVFLVDASFCVSCSRFLGGNAALLLDAGAKCGLLLDVAKKCRSCC
jgi:hypothetical protein